MYITLIYINDIKNSLVKSEDAIKASAANAFC